MRATYLILLTIAFGAINPAPWNAQEASWSPWLNRDNPGGSGDFETLADFVKTDQVCAAPIGIECQTVNGTDWEEAGQIYTCVADKGGICRNEDQKGARCKDYRVRFLCAQDQKTSSAREMAVTDFCRDINVYNREVASGRSQRTAILGTLKQLESFCKEPPKQVRNYRCGCCYNGRCAENWWDSVTSGLSYCDDIQGLCEAVGKEFDLTK